MISEFVYLRPVRNSEYKASYLCCLPDPDIYGEFRMIPCGHVELEEEPSSDEVSELSEEDKRYICEQLHVPPEADVVFQLGEEYYWEGAGVMLIPVSIYENGEYVAGADINRDTKEVMTSIVSYQN